MDANEYKAFRLQMLFGFVLLAGIMALIAVVGLAHVEEKNSYGLPDLIRILGYMGAGFIGWMAGKGHGGQNGKERQEGADTSGPGNQPDDGRGDPPAPSNR